MTSSPEKIGSLPRTSESSRRPQNRPAAKCALLPFVQRCLLAGEVFLVEFQEAGHVRVSHRDFVGQLGAPAAVGFFDAQTVHCIQPEIRDSVILPGSQMAS